MAVQPIIGIVKQVVSGDTIIIRDIPKDCKPHEKTVILTNVNAPRLGKKKKEGIDKDDPYAWEAREFLRKKLVGQLVNIVTKTPVEKPGQEKSFSDRTDRIFGKVFLKDSKTDIAEDLVVNGLARVKADKGKSADPDNKRLQELQEEAKNQKKGIWKDDLNKHVRNVIYKTDNFQQFVAEYGKKNLNAIIEQVRNAPHMILLDVLILPNFISVPVAISGLKVDDENYKEEAKFFVESRLLQQDGVVIVLEKALRNFPAGSVIHPKGNIAELLLQEGLAVCDDFTMSTVTGGAPKLRQAEKSAKDKRLRIWKSRHIAPVSKKEEYQAVVCEIINGEALNVKQANTGEIKKIFLASIRAPKDTSRKDADDKPRTSRTIFDVPWLFEAREFLRTKLIGKKVSVTVDYVQPKKDDFPEKNCCTVTVGGLNIVEALVANGLATVINHRQDDENRSSQYDALQVAEIKAKENRKGMYSKDDPPKHRVTECLGNRAQGLFPMLSKASRIDGIVEHVMSGSKIKLYIPKDSLMITLLLSGISCPKAGSSGGKSGRPVQSEPYGDEALNFTKEKILQRQVEIRVESLDKFGNMIGSLFIGNTNLALALVEEGLATVHHTCSDRNLSVAQNAAKAKKLNIWQNVEEEKKDTNEDDIVERTFNYKEAIVTVVAPDLHIYAQHIDQKQTFNEITEKLKVELSGTQPNVCSREKPPIKGKLYAAKYTDNEWYRGKIEKVILSSGKALVNYVDYGNRENVMFEDLAVLPDSVASAKPFAHEYGLACVQLPPEHYKTDIVQDLIQELADRKLRINVEYYDHNIPYVSIVDAETEEDCVKSCIAKGMFYVQNRKEKKFRSLIEEYLKAQAEAKKERLLIWEYGDAREDDAKEFGLGK